MQENLLKRTELVFQKVFKNKDLTINVETSAKDIAMWDSLTHVELIASLEEEFGIVFSFNEVMQFGNVGDMINLVMHKLNQ